jgi:hypothetical protein
MPCSLVGIYLTFRRNLLPYVRHLLFSGIYLNYYYYYYYYYYYWWGGTESLGICSSPRYLLVPGTAATLAYCTNPDDR